MTETLQDRPGTTDVLTVGPLPYGPEGPPRVLGRLGPETGPTLVCVAGLHGNEPMGVIGLERALGRLRAIESSLRGPVIGLVGNRQALARGVRYVDHDLNRAWFGDRIDLLRGSRDGLGDEEAELVELDREIEPILHGASGEVFLLDLHTTSGPGPAFSVLEDTLANRAFALNFPVPMVLGFEEEVGGTLSDYLCERGVIGIGFEGGQHEEPLAAERAESAVLIAVAAAGLLADDHPEVVKERERLKNASAGLPVSVEVRYRHAISDRDGFEMHTGHRTFAEVSEGQVLACDRRGDVQSPADGLLLMPLYQTQGNDGFFVVRRVKRVWLQLSALVRRYSLERYIHLLPGVRKHTEKAGAFIVNRRVARFLTLELFHLLGFKRIGPAGRYVVLTRRSHDD